MYVAVLQVQRIPEERAFSEQTHFVRCLGGGAGEGGETGKRKGTEWKGEGRARRGRGGEGESEPGGREEKGEENGRRDAKARRRGKGRERERGREREGGKTKGKRGKGMVEREKRCSKIDF